MPLKTFRKNNASIKVVKRQCIEQPHSFHDVLAIRILVLTFSVSPLRFFERDFCPVSFLKRNSGHYHVVLEYLVGMATTCTNVCATCSYNLLHTMRRKEKKREGAACFLLSSKSKQTGIHAVARISIRNRYGKIYVLACESRALCVSSEQKHAVPIIVLRPQMPNTLTSSNNALLFHDHYRLPNKYQHSCIHYTVYC